jgi:hypothetical protein
MLVCFERNVFCDMEKKSDIWRPKLVGTPGQRSVKSIKTGTVLGKSGQMGSLHL